MARFANLFSCCIPIRRNRRKRTVIPAPGPTYLSKTTRTRINGLQLPATASPIPSKGSKQSSPTAPADLPKTTRDSVTRSQDLPATASASPTPGPSESIHLTTCGGYMYWSSAADVPSPPGAQACAASCQFLVLFLWPDWFGWTINSTRNTCL